MNKRDFIFTTLLQAPAMGLKGPDATAARQRVDVEWIEKSSEREPGIGILE